MKSPYTFLIIGLLIVSGCRTLQSPQESGPFFTRFVNLYDSKTEDRVCLKIQVKDYEGLTMLIVLSPRTLHNGFDLHDCGKINNETDRPLEESRKKLCANRLKFLSNIAKIHLEFSPYRFDRPLKKQERKILAGKRVVGAIYLKRTNTAVLVKRIDRHNVYERIETWFLPFIKGLECNWAGINIEQWAKPDSEKTPGHAGLANIDMKENAGPIDASLVAGYTFSDNYRYNIFDHLPHLVFTIRP